MDAFWDDGDGPGTVRHLIAAEPWDAVRLEAFYTLKPEELAAYAGRFHERVASRGARLVLYAAPAARAQAWPDAHRAFQESVNALGASLGAPVAPAVGAYLSALGPAPAPEQMSALYNDWIHATERGNYLIACCLYAAITGCSPVGLPCHAGLPEAEARRYQEAAWQAVLAANPGFAP